MRRQTFTTEPLRAEHRTLMPHVRGLGAAGDAVGVAPTDEQREKVDAAYAFLAEHLIPHAEAEDAVLYQKVNALLGTRGRTQATDTMHRDHVEVGRLTKRLGALREQLAARALTADEQRELRRVLYGLEAVVSLHFAKEEEVYLPLLDRQLTAEQAQALFERMEQHGTAHAHGHAH